MDAEKHTSKSDEPPTGACKFSLTAARDVLARFNVQQLTSEPKGRAITSTLTEFESQLKSLESLYRAQTSLALEFGLRGALVEGCTATGLAGNATEIAPDPRSNASILLDVLSVADNFVDREHVRASAWQTNCSQDAIRKELRAFQKTVNDRLSLAAKRFKLQPRDETTAAASELRTTPSLSTPVHHGPPAAAPAAGPTLQPRNGSQQLLQSVPPSQLPPHQQAGGATLPVLDETVYCLDKADDAARKAQLAKLSKLLNPDTGGIASTPISVVGVFQQLLAACVDWRVRRGALEAMSRSSLDVLWRLLQNSRVLDCLTSWLQEALTDQQATMLRQLLSTMACLPMRRDLLKGSRLEAALESLAGEREGERAGQQRQGARAGAPAAAEDSWAARAEQRRRFGGAAAAVLAEWRRDPDLATILRRAGAAAPEAPAAAAAAAAVHPAAGPAQDNSAGHKQGAQEGSAAAPPPVPGSRLLGAAAAAKDGLRKRSAQTASRPLAGEAARAAPRPRVLDAGGSGGPAGGSGAGSGGSNGAAAAAGGTGGGVSGSSHVAVCGPRGPGPREAGSGAPALKQRAPLSSAAAAALPVQQAVDMTAKLGEKGPADPDVVAGFRSRFGDGSVRRSQLARPARAPVTAAIAAAREANSGPAPPATAARASSSSAAAAAAGTAAVDDDARGPSTSTTPSGGVYGAAAAADLEVDAAAVARLRTERVVQPQAVALAALQAEARCLPEVGAAEGAHLERLRERRKALAARQAVAGTEEEEVRRRLAVLGENVPWLGPPPELLLPPGILPPGTGEESLERLERGRARQLVAKVEYGSVARVPDSPAEPPPRAPPPPPPLGRRELHLQVLLPAPRLIPWLPAPDPDDGGMDWFRQNLSTWERGVRRADLALPPALLHKHLNLDPKFLPPQFAVPAAPAATAHVHANGLGPQPDARQHHQPQSQTSAQRPYGPSSHPRSPPHPPFHDHHHNPPPTQFAPHAAAASLPGSAAPAAAGPWDETPPPPPMQQRPQSQLQQHLNPQHRQLVPLPPPAPLPVALTPAWGPPVDPPQPLLKQAPPVDEFPLPLPLPAVATVKAPLVVLPPPPHVYSQPPQPQLQLAPAPMPVSQVPYEQGSVPYRVQHCSSAGNKPQHGQPAFSDFPPASHEGQPYNQQHHAPPPPFQQPPAHQASLQDTHSLVYSGTGYPRDHGRAASGGQYAQHDQRSGW